MSTEWVSHTLLDQLFPHTIFEVDETVFLKPIAELDQFFTHFFELCLRNERLSALKFRFRLHHVFLSLEKRQPCIIEITPQLNAIGVELFVVRGEPLDQLAKLVALIVSVILT